VDQHLALLEVAECHGTGQRSPLFVVQLGGQLRRAQAFENAGFGHDSLRILGIDRILAGRQPPP